VIFARHWIKVGLDHQISTHQGAHQCNILKIIKKLYINK
jgi:hypothetical protein